jgi:diguanylate cyclase (GGDEF)-like protein/PAS domain S-box-containing protein
MALPTSLAIVGAALGMLCSRPQTGLMEVVWSAGRGGEMARRLLPIGLFAPITLGWLRLAAQRAGYFGIEVGLGVMVISMTALLVGVFLLTAKAVDKSERTQRMAEEKARDLSEQLSAQKIRKSEERFRLLVEGVKDYAIFLLNSKGFVASWNAGAERIKGYRADEIIGQHFSRFYPAEVIAEGKPEKALGTAATEGQFKEEGWRLRKDNSRFWASVVITALRDENGELQGFSKVTRDITERKIMEEALFAEKERAQVTLNCIGDAVACTDIGGHISFLNLVAETMTGWSSQEAVQRHKSEVLRILVTASREIVNDPMDFAVGGGQSTLLPLDCVLVRRDGFEIPIEGSVAPIHDREGKPSGAVIVFRDVRAARAITEQITHSAEHDFLTGLPNRMLLNDRVGQAISLAHRQKKQVAVLFLDLDGFKHINDSLGHSIGDRLLQSIAERLMNCVRSADTVSRQGGDEFVVLLSGMEKPEDAAVSARRMLQEVARSHSVGQHDLYVNASIGISIYPGDGADAETLIKNADATMYQAKEDGTAQLSVLHAGDEC